MKKLLILALTLFSVKSFALESKDPYSVCNRINSGSLKTQCLTSISGRYVDGYAAAACDRIQSAEFTAQCMAAIVDRQYDPRAVAGCDSITTAEATIQCLREVGQPSYGGNPRPEPRPDRYRTWVKEGARYALQQLSRGNIEEVRRFLNELLRE